MDKQQAKRILKNTGYIGNEVGVAFDVAIKSMDKLEKVEQIMKKYQDTLDNNLILVNDLENIPNADVIERSKIDKAIEELRKEIEENHLNVIDYADGEWITKDFVYGAIERFKKNIGE